MFGHNYHILFCCFVLVTYRQDHMQRIILFSNLEYSPPIFELKIMWFPRYDKNEHNFPLYGCYHHIIHMACQVVLTDLVNPCIFHIQTKCGHYSGIIPTNKEPR